MELSFTTTWEQYLTQDVVDEMVSVLFLGREVEREGEGEVFWRGRGKGKCSGEGGKCSGEGGREVFWGGTEVFWGGREEGRCSGEDILVCWYCTVHNTHTHTPPHIIHTYHTHPHREHWQLTTGTGPMLWTSNPFGKMVAHFSPS